MAPKHKKKALTPLELEEEKRQEAERLAREKEIYRLPTTFALVTAQRLLAKLGISMPQEYVSAQILHPKTYYHALLYAPAKRTIVQGYIERCRDIQAYGQQKLIHYLFSGEASKEEEETGHETRVKIEQARLHMVDMGQQFVEWEENCIDRSEGVFDELFERAQAWQRTVSLVVKDLSEYIQKQGLSITKALLEYIHMHLLECSATLILTPELQSKYSSPADFGVVEKTVICLFEQELLTEGFDGSVLSQMRPTFKEFDLRLQAEYDSLTGFNRAAREEADKDIEAMEAFTKGFETEIVNISQMLFKYYSEYASDKALQVDVEHAVEFGVDESVADDFIALHR